MARFRTPRRLSAWVAGSLLAWLTGCAASPPPAPPASPAAPSWREAWTGAAEWLLEKSVDSPSGRAWAADPRDPRTISSGLYSGSAGVVLFLLEAARATGDPRYLAAGRAGADHLAADVETVEDPGLYTGLAGIGYALVVAADRTGEERYRAAARRAVERILAEARHRGAGIEWGVEPPDPENPVANDVTSGTAGTGLFLLWAARKLDLPAARDAAVLAGDRLLEIALPAEPAGEGRRWEMAHGFERQYPNFAHGTAGVAYFLATLYGETRAPRFLDGAARGARQLQAIATVRGDSCLIYRHTPDARDLYYYSWCHGPAGTARLFYRLYLTTGDRHWLDFAERLARGVLASGIPDAPQPGFWNVGQCCGSAGVAEFFFHLYRVTGKRPYLDFSRRMSAHLVAHATREGRTWSWVQAENRTEPEVRVAQTGYMQGAAGIGLWLLRLDAFEHGRRAGVTLPDSPFGDE